MSIAGYISKSKSRGIYRYRRRIPQELRPIWGKLEEKVSLKTKSHPEALRRAAVVNTKFDEKAAQLRKQISGKKLPNRQVMEAAREILVKEGIHPQQIPKTKEEALNFFKAQDEWKDIWWNILPGVNEVKQTPHDRGGWDTEYETDESNPWYQAYNLLTGEEGLSMIPSLQAAIISSLGGTLIEQTSRSSSFVLKLGSNARCNSVISFIVRQRSLISNEVTPTITAVPIHGIASPGIDATFRAAEREARLPILSEV